MGVRQRAKQAATVGKKKGESGSGNAASEEVGYGTAVNSPFGKMFDALGSTEAAMLIFLFAFGLHVNTFEGDFVYDDARGVVQNGDVTQSNALADLFTNDFWGKPMDRYQSHKSYRPLTVLTFRANHQLHSLRPFGFHVVNVLLHCMVCVLFLRASALISGRLDVAFVTALLFTAHSIHTEVVANIVGRAELLSGVFVMSSFLLYHAAASSKRGGFWAAVCLASSMLLVGAAMLSKEQGIAVLGLVAAYDAMILCRLHPLAVPSALAGLSGPSCRGLRFRYTVITATGVLLLVFRMKMMGEGGPIFNEYELPALGCKDPITRMLTFNYYAAFNLHLLLLPLRQSSDWSYGSIPLVESFSDPRFATTCTTYAAVVLALLFLLLKARSQPSAAHGTQQNPQNPHKAGFSHVTMGALLGLIWMLVSFVPSSNLFFNVGFVIAERILYLPSMGYCIVLGTAFYQSAFRAPTLSKFVLSALLLFLSARTIQRNAVWRSDFSLHEAGATEHPRNIKLMTNYGMLLHDRAKDTPENTRSEGERKQYYKDAEDVYKKGLKSLGEQRFPNLYFVYGNLYHETDRLDEAVDIYNLGLKKIDKTGTTLNLLNNLATIYYKQEKFSLSETAFKKAVEIKPEHWSSRNGLAVLYAATKRPGLAEIEFKAMLRMRPGYPEALFNYGTMLAADSSRFVDAKKLFQQVLKASPGHSGATSNLKYVEYKMNENS